MENKKFLIECIFKVKYSDHGQGCGCGYFSFYLKRDSKQVADANGSFSLGDDEKLQLISLLKGRNTSSELWKPEDPICPPYMNISHHQIKKDGNGFVFINPHEIVVWTNCVCCEK